ncbi:hypothetical protein B0H13DRAFT_1657130, partial [Mycena leptocephala]
MLRHRNLISSAPEPTPAERRAILAEIKLKIAQRKTDLAALVCAITSLEKAQRVVEESLALIVYPVLTLPYEITSRIFVACLPSDGVRPSPDAAPLLLAQICRHWRKIALSTGELWCSVNL